MRTFSVISNDNFTYNFEVVSDMLVHPLGNNEISSDTLALTSACNKKHSSTIVLGYDAKTFFLCLCTGIMHETYILEYLIV